MRHRITERMTTAERLLTHRHETPALVDCDRLLLLDTLREAGRAVRSRVAPDQLLHGEAHPGNLLSTSDGLLFTDFETCCAGDLPGHFDEPLWLLVDGAGGLEPSDPC